MASSEKPAWAARNASVVGGEGAVAPLDIVGGAGATDALDRVALWAASGAMWLTGPPGGPPRVAPGAPASFASRALDRVSRAAEARTGSTPTLPGVELLGERAALAGLRARWPWSCGGAFRFLPTLDGFLGLSLPRPGDVDLARALVGDGSITPKDLWPAVARWTCRQRTAEAVERSALLGLGCASLPAAGSSLATGAGAHSGRPAVLMRRGAHRSSGLRSRPLVVDLTALWAGPLCANLLGLSGAQVVKVESTHRPDAARAGSPALFELLHRGHQMLVLDFQHPGDLVRLRELVATADLVLEASRPRALAQLGLIAEEVVDRGTSWLSITARGRISNTVGFGDDTAAEGGLVLWQNGTPAVCGDAIGDPLSGLAAAAAASEALLDERAQLVDVSMIDVCREAAADVCPAGFTAGRAADAYRVVEEGGRWWVDASAGRYPVLEPRIRWSSSARDRR